MELNTFQRASMSTNSWMVLLCFLNRPRNLESGIMNSEVKIMKVKILAGLDIGMLNADGVFRVSSSIISTVVSAHNIRVLVSDWIHFVTRSDIPCLVPAERILPFIFQVVPLMIQSKDMSYHFTNRRAAHLDAGRFGSLVRNGQWLGRSNTWHDHVVPQRLVVNPLRCN